MPGAEIHPSAIVDAKAEIGDDVRIGPYCVVEAHAVLGDGCVLRNHVTIGRNTTIGPRNTFFPNAAVGLETQDLKYEKEPTYLKIGEGNTFRECVTVHRSTEPESATRIGNFGSYLAYAHIAHDCNVGDHVIFSNNGTLAGHVTVEDHAVLGGLSAVHQFCRLGRHAITGGCSKIVQDIPPFMIVDGNPARVRGVNSVGLERRGFSAEEIRSLKEAYRVLFRGEHNMQQAVERIEANMTVDRNIRHLLDFIASSERGVIR